VPVDFTVIIPTLNEGAVIETTLQHIKRQKTRASFEIVVVDGGSEDNTREIAQRYARVLNARKKDKAYQLNYAAAHTDSKYLIFLDADTLIPENYIERIRLVFEQDPQLWVCGAHISYKGAAFGIFHLFILIQGIISFLNYAFIYIIWSLLLRRKKTRYILNEQFFFSLSMVLYYSMRQFLGSPELSGANICARRDIFNELGGFQKPAKLGVDWLFCHIVKTHIRKVSHGKMKIIPHLIVETDARHLALERSLKRLKTHRDYLESVTCR